MWPSTPPFIRMKYTTSMPGHMKRSALFQKVGMQLKVTTPSMSMVAMIGRHCSSWG